MIIVRLKAIAEPKGWKLNRIQKSTGSDMGVLRRYWYWEDEPPKTESLHIPTLEKLCHLLEVDLCDLVKLIPDNKT